MAFLDDLRTARDNLAAELAKETADRRTDQLAGKGVKTTYSANGRSVDWLGYLKTMREEIQALDKDIGSLDPYEHVTQAY